ncbi:MAG: OmpA family protein [Nitrospirae bacterium]|nr:OmpA family protein [Nitrospirota bacterium]
MPKKKHEEHENHERWLVSYADFITLLFAFFVVMYSTSSIQEGKYRAVSESAQAAFNPSSLTAKHIEVGPKMSSGNINKGKVEYIATIKSVMKEFEQSRKLVIFQNSKGIVIRITDTALFDSGNSEIKNEAVETIDNLAGVLTSIRKDIQIEGHTDNIPINSPKYPSNWELSSARATSIVRRFVNMGLEPSRLTAIGYGEYRPIADNDTAEGRSKNRRVDILVLNDKQTTAEEQFPNPFANLKIE